MQGDPQILLFHVFCLRFVLIKPNKTTTEAKSIKPIPFIPFGRSECELVLHS